MASIRATASRQPAPSRAASSGLAARYTFGGWRADAAILFGVTSTRSAASGYAAGSTYVFNAFQVP